jgi:hypothetical protein
MIKVADKPSQDPAQQQLRQSKKFWNKQVSALVDDLFQFKNMMNGKPSKFFKEKSSIKNPIPANPASIIGQLASRFQEITQQGIDIIQAQDSYSKNRRKKQPKQVQTPAVTPAPVATNMTPPADTPDLSKQLAAAYEYDLIVEASNPLTRFFARLLTPTFGSSPAARIRRYRMSLLKSAADMYKDLDRLQTIIVGSSPDSIFASSKLLNKIEDNWTFLTKGFVTYKSTITAPVADTGGKLPSPDLGKDKSDPKDEKKGKVTPAVEKGEVKPPVPAPVISNPDLAKAIADYQGYASNFLDLKNSKHLNALIVKYMVANDTVKSQLVSPIIIAYHSLLAEANTASGTTGQSLKEIWDAKMAKQKTSVAQLEIVAQTFVDKWLGKAKHQLSPFDKTSAFRLDIYNLTKESLKALDKIMDSLEKEMNVEQLGPMIAQLNSKLSNIRELIRGLESTLRGKSFDSPFIDLLERGRLTEHSPDLSDKQRENLQKMLEQRQIRDLTNLYYRR